MAHETNGPGMRVISPTECERRLGFEPDWTHPGGKASPGLGYQKRTAIGNAFTVPVITRLLLALTMTVQGEGEASFIANCYGDLVSKFEDYIAPHWHGDLVGPDPGAGGTRNRTQRAAAIGVQQNTHLSRDGLQLLIPEPRLAPQEHVAQAQKLLHPFSHSPELPLDLKSAAELTVCYSEQSA